VPSAQLTDKEEPDRPADRRPLAETSLSRSLGGHTQVDCCEGGTAFRLRSSSATLPRPAAASRQWRSSQRGRRLLDPFAVQSGRYR